LSEEIPVFSGKLTDEGVNVTDSVAWNTLDERGYGDSKEGRFYIKDYEAMFLLYVGKLNIKKGKDLINLNELLKFSLNRDPDAWTKFLIYRDLRSRGYIAKEGFGFGADFRVYERGGYEKKRAKFVVFCINEGINVKVGELSKNVREIETMGKNAIAAVVERRGEVIYYKLTNMKFNENKKQETSLTLQERK